MTPRPTDPAGQPGQKAGAAELQEVEARFRATFEQAAVGIAHVGLGGEWLRVNQRLCRILGYPLEELTRLTWQQITHPEDLELDLDHARRLLAGEIPSYTLEKRYLRGDGSVVWANLTGSVVQGADGSPAYFIAVVEDISQRKVAEAELVQTNERLALLLRSAAGLLRSEQPGEFLQVLFAELERRFGVAAYFNYLVETNGHGPRLRLDSFGGAPAEAMAPYGWLDLGVAVCGTVARDRTPMVVERIQQSDDARTALVRSLGIDAYACHPLLTRGELVGTLSFGLRDRARFTAPELELLQAISDHAAVAIQRSRTRESERAARLEAEQAMQARSEFMATVSHELRTPLNAIIGYTQLLEQGIPTPLPESHLRSVQRIGFSAHHLQQLIDEILAFARLEAGREYIDAERVGIDELVQEVRAVIEPLAAARNLGFSVTLVDAPDQLETDPRKLRQILLNLLGNAIKFTDRGQVTLELRGEAEQLAFTVTDTGIGIAPKDMHRLFEPFWQADGSRTRRTGGTGLGLPISRRFAELLGGSITCESRWGDGTTFTLRLPLRARAGGQ